MTPATLLDALILAWLVGTWFYEGHHRQCEVKALCPECGRSMMGPCNAGQKPPKG